MSLETYMLIISILSILSVVWWIVSDYLDKRNSFWCAAEIKKLSDENQKLKHENLRYYRKYGVLQDSENEQDSL